MTNFDNETIERFVEFLRDIAKSEANDQIRNIKIETYRDMQVRSVENIKRTSTGSIRISDKNTIIEVSYDITKFATVSDMVTGETLKNVPNCTGEALVAGDIVRVFTSSDLFPNSKQQSYIGAVIPK